MKIVIIVEGSTEKVFLPYLRAFLESRLSGTMPALKINKKDGRIPTGDRLRRLVERLLNDDYDHVVALTDVYTGSKPPEFVNAADAKEKMRRWVGAEPRFHPHVAQHDFEAWLLPYWPAIQKLAGHNQNRPSGRPESVNHGNPPAHRLKDLFELGSCRRSYSKIRDAASILRQNDLSISISECPELKALVNTLLGLSGGALIP